MFYTWPVSGTSEQDVTSHYGKRINPITQHEELHKGIDIAATKGTPILAIADARISYMSEGNEFMGTVIVYETDCGIRVNNFHLTSFAPGVKAHDRIHKGQEIAYVGKTGMTTGYHLHFQAARKDQPKGESFDPMELWPSKGLCYVAQIITVCDTTCKACKNMDCARKC